MCGELVRADKTVGVKQTIKAVQKGIAVYVYVARDADRKVVSNLEEMCRTQNVPLKYAESLKQLGKACGIDVGASAVGVIRSKNEISKEGGE